MVSQTTTTLTAQDQRLLRAVITQMKDVPAVDYGKVAEAVGIRYKGNAKKAFKNVWAKLRTSTPSGGSTGSTKKMPSHSSVVQKKRKREHSEDCITYRQTRPQRNRNMSQKGIDSKLANENYPSELEVEEEDEANEKGYKRRKQHLWNKTPESDTPDTQRDDSNTDAATEEDMKREYLEI
ncbi:hypothetical protein BP6252_00120 [Coleophoma cylindrospora]|uniref:Myb-like domain-containing protein n=1 Tax=Coleophoma cylindrospora TaxID=1849047 RepID=A0A3D8SQL7_9HELO|nr:hypothetical protein BP6252_00120 [Coleophoma cylindrospora]